MNKKSIKAVVSGKVQKVWFRANTQKKALELGLVGQAINLANGNVEVKACGSEQEIDALIAWLHIGSEKSVVEQVLVTALQANDFENMHDFITG